MPVLFPYFSLDFVLIDFFGYPLSLLEILGTVSGLFCVYLASRNYILTWPIGIFNSICFFFLFYQIQLYSDMLLQIYFFASSIYGWILWKNRNGHFNKIRSLDTVRSLIIGIGILVFTYFLGMFSINLPNLLPDFFSIPPSYPYWDAFTTVASVVANFLLARRILQSWFLWVLVDIVCIVLYFLKGIPFVTGEYFIFLIIAVFGSWHWYKSYKENMESTVYQ